MRRISMLDRASRGFERALEQSFTRSDIAGDGNWKSTARETDERIAPRGSLMNLVGPRLFILVLVGVALAGPSVLLAGTPSFGNATNPNAITQSDSSSMDGQRSQDKPSHLNSRPDRKSGQDGTPGPRPQHPAPPVRPPSHTGPPSHSSPRPPLHYHPHYGPGWPNYAWGSGNG